MSAILKSGILTIFVLVAITRLQGQCTGTISAFPYVEDFEVNDGGWTSGGIADDWGWGAPNKPVISAAGSGNKCWIVGGPNQSNYNVNERSYLLTPCFDFTNIENPMVAFKIFWESEHTYDGTNLQYSINDGTTWTNVGNTGQQFLCYVQNWYNIPNITNLTTLANPKTGWSGNIQTDGDPSCGLGGGSGEWKLATYCIDNLAGQPEVRFRFTFGAGSICNQYDGVAIDSFTISEAPPLFNDFTITVNGCGYDIDCEVVPLMPDACFGSLSWNWTFGDMQSASSISNASHTYDSPGTYDVTLTTSGVCFSQNIVQPVTILDPPTLTLSATISNCGQNNGSATVLSAGGSTPIGYTWSTIPPQTTATATNLAAGNYSVTVTLSNNCTVTSSITVDSDVAIPDVQVADNLTITCTNPTVSLGGSSATPNVSFTWTGPNGFNNNTPNPAVSDAGTYTLVVEDLATGCTAFANTTVALNNTPPTVNAGADQLITCSTPTVSLQAATSSNNAVYDWTGPDGFTGSSLQINTATPGDYTLEVTDNISGCSNQDEVTVASSDLNPDTTIMELKTCIESNIGTQEISLLNQFGCDSLLIINTIYNDTSIFTYLYDTICQTTCIDFNGACLDQPGIYQDTLLTTEGCDSIIYFVLSVVHCPWLDQAIYVPNVFSPNYDGINDKFKAEGINFDTYEMRIFDRWGNYIFQTNTANEAWDGTYRGKPADIGVYAYYVVVRFINGNTIEKKGDVLLVR